MGSNETGGYHFQTLLGDERSKTESPMGEQASSMSRLQGYILIGLAAGTLILVGWFVFHPAPKYAYKVINVQAQFSKQGTNPVGSSAENNAKLNGTNVNLSDDELTLLGKEGWQLVDTILEMETTHPNYGSTEYVTGLQPNIRPQRAIID
jgi:hypothetical protein